MKQSFVRLPLLVRCCVWGFFVIVQIAAEFDLTALAQAETLGAALP
jgi:hypothetical protein